MTTACDSGEMATLIAQMGHLVERMRTQRRQFITDASHELGTPLAGLRLQLEEAGMHPGQTDLGELVGNALREVDRMQAVLRDLLTLAGLDDDFTDSPQVIDVTSLVGEQVGRRACALPIHHDLEEGLLVSGVTSALTRLLGNLLDNAERHGESAVRVTVFGESDGVVVTVEDDGPGIPLPQRDRVFDHFARIDTARSREHGGTGLGLPIAQAIAQAHRGTLTVQDSDLGGARLVLRLPLLYCGAMTGEAA
ncbi:hypothetical protein GCM10022419_116670 [Nonomuraea rosea]|uniref:histidine kinase n=1 Tax=Nonomuraea rosea TaxID=638574 RepID=A0ABP6ZQU8_9ACTN